MQSPEQVSGIATGRRQAERGGLAGMLKSSRTTPVRGPLSSAGRAQCVGRLRSFRQGSLGAGDARLPRVGLDGLSDRPGQSLEDGFADVMAVEAMVQ